MEILTSLTRVRDPLDNKITQKSFSIKQNYFKGNNCSDKLLQSYFKCPIYSTDLGNKTFRNIWKPIIHFQKKIP